MRLYHFTGLIHLPAILREGLTQGEVPVSPRQALNAPSFTTNPNPQAQYWHSTISDKRKVRLDVDVPDDHLEPWRDVSKRLKVDRRWQRALDPYGQGKFWYLYWGVVPPDRIRAVEVRTGGEYAPVSGPALEALVARIDAERARLRFDGPFVRIIDGGPTSWLIQGDDV